MICYICGNEAKQGKTYTFSQEAKKVAITSVITQKLFQSQEKFFVCDECCANPLKQFAQTLFEMFFWGSKKQRIKNICQMFQSGAVRLPRGVSLEALRQELNKR